MAVYEPIEGERWADIAGYDGLYAITSAGVVISRHGFAGMKERKLSPGRAKNGYLTVCLKINGRGRTAYVHRLVAEAFSDRRDGHTEVNHINGVKTDNRASNLEWVSRSENARHAIRTGLWDRANSRPNATLTESSVREIRALWEAGGRTKASIARQFSVHPWTVGALIARATWKNVGTEAAHA